MKKLTYKIALPIFLALVALVLCIFGNSFIGKRNQDIAEAVVTPGDKVTIKTDKKNLDGETYALVAPGDELDVEITIHSGLSSGYWMAVTLTFGILNENNMASPDAAQYLSLIGDVEHNLTDYAIVAAYNADLEAADNDASKVGMYISIGNDGSADNIDCSSDVVIKFKLKLEEDENKIGSTDVLKFGISDAAKNNIKLRNTATNKTFQTKFTEIADKNYVNLKLGKVSSNPNLSKLEAGVSTLSVVATDDNGISTSLSQSIKTANRTGYKIKPTAKDGAVTTIKYSVGASSNPKTGGTAIDSGKEATITLDTTGTTVVKFYTVAEDKTSEQNYTLTIKNTYVSLSGLTLTVNRQSGAPTLDSTFNKLDPVFAQDTDTVVNAGNFTVKIPSDHTQVQITPTVAANFGINNQIAVQATGATASGTTVNSGSVLTLTNVTEGATVKFTATGVDNTTKVYTITFSVKNVDTSITSLTMTSGGKTVNGTSTGTGYSFTLEEEAGYKGTFNATLGSTKSKLKIGSADYSASTEYTAAEGGTSLTFVVTAEAGNTKSYTVNLSRLIKAGELKDLKYQIGTDAQVAVDGSNSSLSSGTSGGKPNNVYTIKLDLDPANYVGKIFKITGTPTSGATTSTSTNLSGAGSNAWQSSGLAYNNGGTTTYTVTVTSATGVTTYNFEVSLKENKNSIQNIVIKKNGTTTVIPFDGNVSFNSGSTSYTINVPYKDYASVDVEVTTDGKYCKVEDGEGTYTTTAGTTSHKRSNISLAAGTPKTLTFSAKADNGNGNAGTSYTVIITRQAADTGAQLKSLDVKINGVSQTFKEGTFVGGTLIWNIEFDASSFTGSSVPIVITAVPQSAKATITSDSDGSTSGKTINFALTKGQEKSATYTIKVQPEEGPTTNYTINVKNVIPDPEFTDLQISYVNQSSYVSVLAAAEYNSSTKTYTVTKRIEADNIPLNSSVYIKGTVSSEATATATGVNQVTANQEWKLNQLAYGKNSFTITVAAKGTSQVYKFDISLLEGKNDITGIVLKKGTETLNFLEGVFNVNQYTYNIKVPYTYNTGNIDIEVTTDGLYTSVVDGNKTYSSNVSSNKHTSTINCATLSTTGPTTIVIKAIADPTITPNEFGTPYTINIEREAADVNANLSVLRMFVAGTEVSFDGGVSFNPATDTYTYTIPSPAPGTTNASVEIYAVADSEKSTITGNTAMGAYNATDTKFSFTYTYPTSSKTDTYQIFVTPESGAAGKKTYTVQIKREIAKGDLTDVKISYDGLYFTSVFSEFDAVTKIYSGKIDIGSLPKGLGSDFYVQAESTPDSTIEVNYLTKYSDHYVGKLSQFGNKNVFEITAKTGSGSTKYTINIEVYEDKDGISDIKMLSGSNEVSPDIFVFGEYTDTYNVEVDFTVSSVLLRVKAEGDYEIIKADGATVSAKKPDGYYEISSGTLGVTAKTIKVYGVANLGNGRTDGTAKGTEYTFNIKKAEADKDTTLASLVVKVDGTEYDLLDGSNGNPINFDPNGTEYWVEFEKWGTATAATVSIEAEASTATSTVTGLPTGSNNFKYDVKKEHEETYNIVVTAQNGTDKLTYKVHVKRLVYVGDFTTLEIKLPKENSYSSVFDSANYDEYDKIYTLNLTTADASAGSTITVKAIPNSGSTASTDPKLTVRGNEYSIKLEHGRNEYNFIAESATGSTTYKFVINYFEDKNGIEKISFKHDKGTIGTETFNFNKNTNSYQFNVANTISSLTMTVVTEGDYATVVDGDGNTLNPAKVARNFETVITLEAGQTTTIGVRAVSDTENDGDMYWIEITREAADSDTTLKSLSVTVGGKTIAFVEYFDPELTDYTIYLEANESGNYNAVINAIANKTTTTVTGTGSKQVQLANVASQLFEVVTTAQNGDMRTYTITFFQKAPVVVDYIAKVRLDNDKSLAFTVNSDSQAFDVYKAKEVVFTKDKVNFEIVSAKSGLTYTVSKIVDGNKTEEIDNEGEKDYTLELNIGTNVYCVNFDLGNGEIKPVVFVIERVNPSLDGLSAREISNLVNDYTPEVDTYSYSVGSDITSLTLTVDVDTSIYRYTIEGAENLEYGMNSVVIKLYEKGKIRAKADPVRVITLSIYRESNNMFWMIMTIILSVLAFALVIIIILVKNRSNHNNNDQDPIVVTPAPSGGQIGGGNLPIIINPQNGSVSGGQIGGGNLPLVINPPHGSDRYYDQNDGNIY